MVENKKDGFYLLNITGENGIEKVVYDWLTCQEAYLTSFGCISWAFTSKSVGNGQTINSSYFSFCAYHLFMYFRVFSSSTSKAQIKCIVKLRHI